MQDSDKKENISKTDSNPKTDAEAKPNSKKLGRWLEIFGFLIVFAITLKVVSYMIDPIRTENPNNVNPRERHITRALMAKPDTMDVMILGDSEAMVMASPEQMMNEAGILAYNCNQLGQRISETYYFLGKLLKKQHPKILILETNVITQDTTLKKEAEVTFKNFLQEEFCILRYHSSWRQIFGLKKPDKYTAVLGYEPVEVVDPYTGGEYMFETDERFYVNPITFHYLDKIIELCNKKDIKVILVTSPSAVHADYSTHNTIQDYADEHGLAYIDFNILKDEIGIDWKKDTGDKGDHINKYGAEKTTNYLIKYLKENYDLPDHRND